MRWKNTANNHLTNLFDDDIIDYLEEQKGEEMKKITALQEEVMGRIDDGCDSIYFLNYRQRRVFYALKVRGLTDGGTDKRISLTETGRRIFAGLCLARCKMTVAS